MFHTGRRASSRPTGAPAASSPCPDGQEAAIEARQSDQDVPATGEGSKLEQFYARLASRLYPRRGWLWVLGCAACAAFAVVALGPGGEDDVAMMALGVAALLWVAGLLTMVYGFAAAPPPPDPRAGFAARIRQRIARVARTVMVLIMTGLAAVVLVVTVRALVLVL